MARGVNKVILVGFLGDDPKISSLPSGSIVANLRVSTSENIKDRSGGPERSMTEWHQVAVYGQATESVRPLVKGSQVYVEGRLQTRKWQDKTTGQDRWKTEIVAREVFSVGDRATDAEVPGAKSLDDIPW